MFESPNINVERPFIDELPLQPNKEVSVEKSIKTDEEDGAKPKLSETRKVTRNTRLSLILFRMMIEGVNNISSQNSISVLQL